MKRFSKYIIELEDPSLDKVNKVAGVESEKAKINPPRLISGNGFRYIFEYLNRQYALDFTVVGTPASRTYRSDLHLLSVKDDQKNPKGVATKLGMSSTSKNLEPLLIDMMKHIKDFTNRKRPNIIYFMPVTKKTEFAMSTPLHSKIFDMLHTELENKKEAIGNYKIKRGSRDEIDDKLLGNDLGFAFKMTRGGGQDIIRGKANLPKF